MKKLLLDTHTLLWSIGKSNELSSIAVDYISDSRNEVFVSAVSLWEIALKYSIGKLVLDFDVNEIPELCSRMAFSLLPIDPLEALGCLKLPNKENHKDPFDRMLIYQCIRNGYTLISKDSKMKLYKNDGLNCIW
ncbi:twitching motility protein PilT [Bacteroidia bacterium]|nr:twitching motility protein PilT [Bacteroidia bacterium]GHT81525.1 twitching motility protein PilT [Bacteroidia bacterium]